VRFVANGKFVRLSLSAIERDAEVIVYRGDRAHSQHVLPSGAVTSLFLEDPASFTQVGPEALSRNWFAPYVWRITFNQDAIILYHHLEGFGHEVRPLSDDEIPQKNWLAYGSSITFGGNAYFAPNAYIQQAAIRLGVDVLNKGLPGSCFCEPQIAEFLSRMEWDFATLELGVNLVGLATPEVYALRACTLIDQVHQANLDKPVFAIDIYLNIADWFLDRRGLAAQNNQPFRDIGRSHVAGNNHRNLRYIPADQILDDLTSLSVDFVHPSDDGHIRMGENLAEILIKEFL